MYTAFAKVYDALMADVDYAAWAAHYARLMEACGVRPGARTAECACGTGGLTLPLAKLGYRMTGIDVSEDMLAAAMAKARAAGLLIPFVRQDMAALALPRRAECILCTCDGVNYLDTPQKVRAFFAAAYDALQPGGALIFDVSTPFKLKNTLGNQTLTRSDEDISYIWQNRYDEKTARVEMSLSIFVRAADGRYDRLEETQRQRGYEREELRAWLKEAGFSGMHFYGRRRMAPPRPADDRWHVAARKG